MSDVNNALIMKENSETLVKMGSDKQSKLDNEIIRQVEYYFGDFNLSRDRFLMEQISNSAEGWVPLNVLLTFKRLAALTTDAQTVADAIMKSDKGLLELSEDKAEVRRHPKRPIRAQTDELRQEWASSTIYAKGFPLDAELSDIIDFFEQFEKVLHVTMRKYIEKGTNTHKFKGSVFVTFEKKEQAAAFIEKEVFFKECELIHKLQKHYLEEKEEEMKIMKMKQQHHQKTAEKWKLENLPKGTVVFFENGGVNITREMLRAAIVNEGDWSIAYIDHNKEEKSGYIRFQEDGLAGKFLASLEDNKLRLEGDLEVTLRALNEEEETKYLAEVVKQINDRHRYLKKLSQTNRKRRKIDNGTAAEKKGKADG